MLILALGYQRASMATMLEETVAEELTGDTIDTQIDNIDVAADILRRMSVELQGLEVHCARLHFAMSTSGHAIRQRLDMLSGIAELLKSGEAPLLPKN
jgi:hypothetical protein